MICQINGALTFFVHYFNRFFLRLIITCRSWVIYVREDNYSNVKVMITRLIWTIWTPMSSVPKKVDKHNLCLLDSVVLTHKCVIFSEDWVLMSKINKMGVSLHSSLGSSTCCCEFYVCANPPDKKVKYMYNMSEWLWTALALTSSYCSFLVALS